jgi:hypothetical protein
VLVLSAGPPTLAAIARAVRLPVRFGTSTNAAVGGLALGSASRGVAGPTASAVPHFQALLALAIAGGVALPQLRRGIHAARVAERRVRQRREAMYSTARSALRRD